MKILFSPLGDSDPIRGCYDGACLHIIRHYHPVKTVLFYTKEMEEKERCNHFYTYSIKKLAPDIEIEEIFSGIEQAHLYDNFVSILTEHIIKIHEVNPEAEILLNLSSGTPAIKTVMAIVSVEYDKWCRGIQVSSPMNGSNRNNEAATESPEDLWENNLDNEEGTENRCSEPKLQVIRNYAERSRILSLLDKYEYATALSMMRNNTAFSAEAIKLTKFAEKRLKLKTDEAKKIFKKYAGVTLFPFDKQTKTEELIEYFLAMQIMQRQSRISDLLLRMAPFLDKCLRYYVEDNAAFHFNNFVEFKNSKTKRQVLIKSKIKANEPELARYLDRQYSGGFNDKTDIASQALSHIVNYMGEAKKYKDSTKHNAMCVEIAKIEKFSNSRNENAHELKYTGEREFYEEVGLSSSEAVDTLSRMLCLIYGDMPKKMRNIYDELNGWIEGAVLNG